VPGIRGISERCEGFEGNGPAEAAQKSRFEGDRAAILVDCPCMGDDFAKGLAFKDRFIDEHENAIIDKGYEGIDDRIMGRSKNTSYTCCGKNDNEYKDKDVINNQVAQEVLLGIGVYIRVFHKVIYKKSSVDFCDFWLFPANNYMMTDLNHNELIFLQLIGDNKGILYKICHLYCRNKDDREDLMQEMIYQLWRSGQQFDANYKFSTWMYRIALNVAISFYRKQTRSGVRIALGGDLHLMELEDRSPDNEELEEKIDLLQQFISELGELDKALMILYLEERPYREIAEILGISETNVATKLSRIKGRLKQQFLQSNKLFL